MEEKLRESGIDIIGGVPWGFHFCQFYQTEKDRMDVLIPYFKAGLENNEFCLWVTSDSQEREEIKEALREAISDFDVYLEKRQIEIIPYSNWYMREDTFDPKRIFNCWTDKLDQALANGYDGLRGTEDLSWLKERGLSNFVDYEEKLHSFINGYRMIFLCTYCLDTCDATEVVDIITNHRISLMNKKGKWERIEIPGYKGAEEAVAQASKNWEHTFDAVPDLIAILDSEHRIIQVNKAMASRLRMTPEKCKGLTCYRAIHGTNEPPPFCPHQQLLKDGLEHTIEVQENSLNGTFMVSVSPLTDVEGKLIGSVHVARDITESKKVSEELQKAEERYRIITEQIGQLVYDRDVEKNIVSWAGNIKEFTGYDPEEFKNMDLKTRLSRVHPEDLDKLKNSIRKYMRYGGTYRSEYRCKKSNGSYIFIEDNGVCLKGEDGKVNRVLGVIKDITERKLSQERLEISERKYRSFIENFKGIVYQTDENFIPQLLHGAVEEITGYTEEELISELPWKEIIDPEYLPVIRKEKIKLRNAPGAHTIEREFRIRNREGKIKWVHETCQKIPGENKGPIYQGVIYDITKRKQAEEALSNLESARKKETHHRIKNNLQVISSLLDLEAEKFKNREYIKDSEFLEAFKESQDRIISVALIHKELHEGKGIDKLNFSLYLEKLVENLFRTYRLGDVDLSLNMELEENIFFDTDTAVPLGLIVNEILSNSLKYAFSGRSRGKIQIKLCRKTDRRYKSNIRGSKKEEHENTNFILTISDNGTGIPESIDLENSGTLGIQLVTILVDQLEGELELKRDSGTEFVIRFST